MITKGNLKKWVAEAELDNTCFICGPRTWERISKRFYAVANHNHYKFNCTPEKAGIGYIYRITRKK
jgi:hypothetical protein